LKNPYLHLLAIIALLFLSGFRFPAHPDNAAAAASNAAEVLRLATAFKAMLSETQIRTLEIPLTKAAATKWTNIPGGASNRNGLQFSTLSPEQLAAAKAVIKAAAGTAPNEGYDEFVQIGLADQVIKDSGKNGYGVGEYIIAFLGRPSSTGTWMLQFGGHHYAQNVVYDKGKTVSATPIFEGGDTREWTTEGKKYAPLFQEHEGMAAMLASLSAGQLTRAKAEGKISDVLLGTTKDGQFPATKAGIKIAELNTGQKAQVIQAMMPWLNDIDGDLKQTLLKRYTRELDDTYISFSGNDKAVAGNAASFLQEVGDYVRIDGPGVWIEFACQPGVFSSQSHYHTVFRDHRLDYNNLWDF